MLHEFLTENRLELATRCRSKVATRSSPAPTTTEVEYGVPVLIDQLAVMLRNEQVGPRIDEPAVLPSGIGQAASKHGGDLLRRGFSIDQVVHDYGDLCQALTELAHEKHAPISVDEFHTFNRCLDSAIASAVGEFGRQRDHVISKQGAESLNERLGRSRTSNATCSTPRSWRSPRSRADTARPRELPAPCWYGASRASRI